MSQLSIMGNQRQVLKDNIEKELVSKIETAKDVLAQLNKNLEMSKENSLSAKEEIRATTEAMREVLMIRKKELVKEVDNLHNVQTRSLQDAMKSTYITMGKLQSMLTNLDTFDQSQLVKLQIPQVSMTHATNEQTQISVSSDCDQLKEDLGEWGNVTMDGFQSFSSDKKPLVYPSANPYSRFGQTRSFETQKTISPCSNKENQNGPAKATTSCATCPWSNWGVQDWLSGGNSRKMSADSNTKDDFLIVSSPCSESSEMDFIVPSLDIENTLNQMCGQVHDDGESGSSIVCIEKYTESEPDQSDLSAWLKPRKQAARKDIAPPTKFNEVILSSDMSNFLSTKKRNVTLAEKRTLDFPCLKMESDNWVHKKKAKSVCSSSSSEKASSLNLNKEKLIPPTYALPNPFWLKKYQHQR